MPNTSVGVAAEAAPKSFVGRFFGIITSPKETFRSVVAHPRWFGMLAVITFIVALCSAAPMFTEAGKEAGSTNRSARCSRFGMQVNDQMYDQMRQRMRFAPYTTAGFIIVLGPIFAVILTGILFAIFNAALGGEASSSSCSPCGRTRGDLVARPDLHGAAQLARGAVGSATSLAVLLPMIDETSFLGRLLGMVDLFVIWWLFVLAIGLGVLYRRRTQPIALGLFRRCMP